MNRREQIEAIQSTLDHIDDRAERKGWDPEDVLSRAFDLKEKLAELKSQFGSHGTKGLGRRIERLQSKWESRATAPPPAAAASAGPSVGSRPTPAAFDKQAPASNKEILKAIQELRDEIREVISLLREPEKPGFDKKGKFTPGGPSRDMTARKPREKDGFMQSALAAFVHNLRTG